MNDEPETYPLSGIRSRIDQVDESLLGLLAERMDLVREIGLRKTDRGTLPVHDPARERELQQRWSEAARKHGLSGAFAERLLRELLDHSKRSQEWSRRGSDYRHWLRRAGYQGEPAAHSELALRGLYGTAADALERIGLESFERAFDALERGEVDGIIVPVENTISGAIPEIGALLAERGVTVLDEELWPVRHCLAAPEGTGIGDLREVLSHPVALAQCRRRLAALGLKSLPWTDTAAAANAVAGFGGRSRAAVCSPEAAARAGLAVIQRDIADSERNVTRFLLLARGGDPRVESTPDPGIVFKTTLIFTVRHEPGALVDCLALFARHGLNLCRVESRIRAGRGWRYAFFVDFEGHADDPPARLALSELGRSAEHVRVLGSYPDRVRQSGAVDL